MASNQETVCTEYKDAYQAFHGSCPSIELRGSRYSIVTDTGFFADYSEGDVRNLTRALRLMASRVVSA